MPSFSLYLEQIDHNGEPQESSLFPLPEKIDHDGKPQDFFTSGLYVIQMALIVLPVSHKEIRRILGWLLLLLSRSLVPTKSTKKHPSLGAPNGTQVGVCSNNLDLTNNTSHLLFLPTIWGPHLKPKWRSI